MIGVCGEALIDFTPLELDGELAYKPLPGGSPCNVAVGLARLSKPTAFIGKLSKDRFGDMLRRHLTQNGVDLRWLARGDEPTALAFVVPSASGEHVFAFYGKATAEQSLLDTDIPKSLPNELTALHFGSYSLMLGRSAGAYERLMRRESGSRIVSLDPNVRPALFPNRELYRQRIEGLLRYAKLVKASEDDLAWLYPGENSIDIANRLLRDGPSVVVVTLGAEGAIGLTADVAVSSSGARAPGVRVPGVRVDVVDTVGAGDAFMSALLAYMYDHDLLRHDALASLSEDALKDALEYANAAAALSCTRQGANPLTRRRLKQFGLIGH